MSAGISMRSRFFFIRLFRCEYVSVAACGGIGKRHLHIEGVAVVADELGLLMARVADRAVNGAAVAQVAVVRIELLALVGELLEVAVAGHALAVELELVIGNVDGRHGIGAVADLAAAHLVVESGKVFGVGSRRTERKKRRENERSYGFHHLLSPVAGAHWPQ